MKISIKSSLSEDKILKILSNQSWVDDPQKIRDQMVLRNGHYVYEREDPVHLEPDNKVSVIDTMKKVAGAAESIVNTTMSGTNRVSLEQFNERLSVCKNCPSGVVTLNKHGQPHRCGKIDDIFKKQGKGKPCGCILKKKAKDKRQDCPMGHWPKLD